MVRTCMVILGMLVLTRQNHSQHPLGRLVGEARLPVGYDSIALRSVPVSVSAIKDEGRGTNV